MDLKIIEDLLEKYYEGATTVEEEKTLQIFFESDEVPDHLKAAQTNFRFFAGASEDNLGEEFDAELIKKLVPVSPKMGIRRALPVKLASGIAAAILLAMGINFYLNTENHIKTPAKPAPDKNALIAYAQAREALLKISNSLNKGNSEVARISKINEIESIVTDKK